MSVRAYPWTTQPILQSPAIRRAYRHTGVEVTVLTTLSCVRVCVCAFSRAALDRYKLATYESLAVTGAIWSVCISFALCFFCVFIFTGASLTLCTITMISLFTMTALVVSSFVWVRVRGAGFSTGPVLAPVVVPPMTVVQPTT